MIGAKKNKMDHVTMTALLSAGL